MNVRKPAVAGQFYQGSRQHLEKELAQLVETDVSKMECLGAISPHAGYVYSGGVAGKVLSRIKFKESFIILGPNHTGIGKPFALFANGLWQTPLGTVEIDKELAQHILKISVHIEEDLSAHKYEHSIEVQLPFLQFLKKTDFKFVPIVISSLDFDILYEVGKELAQAIRESQKEVIIITSTDMTHYETHESAKRKDKRAIDAILKLDEKKLMEEIHRWDITMCGYAPAIVMLSALKELGAKSAELVDYKTSGEISGDYTTVVGYAGILVM